MFLNINVLRKWPNIDQLCSTFKYMRFNVLKFIVDLPMYYISSVNNIFNLFYLLELLNSVLLLTGPYETVTSIAR